MLGQNDAEPASSPDARGYEQELKDLYARRSAIDMLIESLQHYSRVKSESGPPKRKLA